MTEQAHTPEQFSLMLVYREVDHMSKRIDEVSARVSGIDEHGSRGMSGLQVQLTELAKDVAGLDATFAGFRKDIQASRFWLIGAYIGGLLPLYAFIAQQFLR